MATERLLAVIPQVDPDRIDPANLPDAMSAELLADFAQGVELVRGRRAANTVRGYNSDLRVLFAYMAEHGQPPALPVHPAVLIAFIAHEARPDARPGRERPARAASTIDRRLAAIGKAHQLAGLPDPTKDQRVRDALTGARRRLRSAPTKAKAALGLEDVDHMLRGLDLMAHAGRRDKAMLLVALAATLRRSELVALDVEDVRFVPEGMLISIARSKTDQEGAGETLAIAAGDRPDLCAVHALREWLEGAGIREGAIFRRIRAGDRLTGERLSDKAVARTVKKHAARVGLDPDLFSGHSLRSGGITQAVREGHDERELARLSRHKDVGVLRGYIRRENAFEDAAQVLASRRRA